MNCSDNAIVEEGCLDVPYTYLKYLTIIGRPSSFAATVASVDEIQLTTVTSTAKGNFDLNSSVTVRWTSAK